MQKLLERCLEDSHLWMRDKWCNPSYSFYIEQKYKLGMMLSLASILSSLCECAKSCCDNINIHIASPTTAILMIKGDQKHVYNNKTSW